MLDPTHLHLLINHLPVFGSLMGLLVLIYGIISKSDQTKIAAYLVLIVSAIGAGISYFTGDDAAETVENLPGVSRDIIGMHADAALFAVIAFAIVGVMSLVAIIMTKRNVRSKLMAWIVLIITLWAFSVVARTSYLGGQIRHSEIRGEVGNSDNGKNSNNEEDKKDKK